MGCPYVISDIPQLREVHETVEFGAVADRSADAFADALAAILNTPPADPAAARERVLARYSWESLGERYLDAYSRFAPQTQG